MKRPHDLAGLRTARLPLLAELQTLEAETRDRPRALADINAYCTSAVAEVTGRFAYTVTTGEDLANICSVRARADGKVDLGPLLAALLGPDKLAAALMPFADALPPSIDRAAGTARLAEIATELDALEDAEEFEVCRLEALGLQPPRRGDARPSIVLKLRG